MRKAYLLVFEDSDSEDESVARRPRWIRGRENHFHSLDDKDFVIRLRITKQTVLPVLEAIEDNLEFPSDNTSTAHRIVHRVSSAIASLRALHVIFSETLDEIRKSQLDFYNKARFPKVTGAIDCTHVKLGMSPGDANGEIFRDRKDFFLLNVQAICNAKLKFTDIVAR